MPRAVVWAAIWRKLLPVARIEAAFGLTSAAKASA